MALIFLNRYFYPDHSATSQILTELAFSLAKQGRRVIVIASRQRYDDPGVRLPAHEILEGVTIIRVATTRFGRDRLLGRAIDYATFYGAAARTLWRTARRNDIVVAMTDPPMLSLVAAPICRLRKAKLINWLQDIFPEIAIALGLAKGRLARWCFSLLAKLRNQSLSTAAANVAVGIRMADHVAHSGVPKERISVIPNWADGSLIRPVPRSENPLRQKWGLGDAFVVGYSGNLGRAHEAETILGAIIEIERNRSDALKRPVLWLFIGGGAQNEVLKREAERRRLSSVRFQPYRPRTELATSLSVADVHLVSLRPELEGLVVPSKFYGIAAAGRPTVCIGSSDGEIAATIRKHDSGVVVPMGDSIRLAQTIAELSSNLEMCCTMGKRARVALETHYDLSAGVAKWAELLDCLENPPL